MSAALAYLSLGSNMGDRLQNLARASAELARAGVEVVRSSVIYETEPQDFEDQPAFLNRVLAVRSNLSPFPLLRLTQGIEVAMGRVPSEIPKGPRLIDIDILLLGTFIVEDEILTIPHPRMLTRRFVLEPLAEIAPALRHPATGLLICDSLASVRAQGLARYQDDADSTR
ncbi:MAG: 2-amino-4-hydroxy-6-hydroxymethyldihydropteridine diphosphokinase [Bryobacteraceae bacterium]